MKTNPSKFITASMASILIAPAFAIEGPADDAPPPPQVKQESASLPRFKLPPDSKPAPAAQPANKTETAFLGVVSGEVPASLADHLGLGEAEGVLVRSMAPNSPAIGSGIAVNDVITAVAGRSVGSQTELSNQITGHKPGEVVSLDVIHKGKPGKIDVTLGVRPEGLVMAEPSNIEEMNLDELPKEMADHLRGAIGGLDLKLGTGQDAVPPQMEEAIRELQKRLLGSPALPGLDAMPPLPNLPGAQIQSQGSATLKMRDTDGSIEVKSKDGAKEVTLRDHQDNVVWSGPWNTDAERSAAPDSVRRRMESLNLDTNSTGGGLRFQFKQKANPPGQDD